MRILIVGGGVAGLTLMGCLKKRGITDITIVERAPHFTHMGYLIGLWGNGRMVMNYLGIDDITKTKGYEVSHDVIRDKHGAHLRTFPLFLAKDSPATVTISRADLHQGLVAALSDVEIKLGTTVVDITQQEHHVGVRFSDGTEGRFDLVVGADGVHSSVREKVFGMEFLSYYGWGIWTSWLPGSFPYPELPVAFLGRGRGCFILPSHTTSTVTFLARVAPGTDVHFGDRGTQLRELFSDFGSLAAEALRALPASEEIWYDDIAQVRMPMWYRGRVVLMGDAQHAVSPIVGMGSSMAMEDAYVLAEELQACADDIDAALLRYARRREHRINEFLRIVNRVDAWLRAQTRIATTFRNGIAPYVPNAYFTHILRKLLESRI